MTRNTLELGTPNASAIARSVSPFALKRGNGITVCRDLHRTAKLDSSPSRVRQARVDALNGNRMFELRNSAERIEKNFAPLKY